MSKASYKRAIKALKSEQIKIAASRDRLREVVYELDQQADDADTALEDINQAIEKLSELV